VCGGRDMEPQVSEEEFEEEVKHVGVLTAAR
jgi:hypothetical protein